MIQYERMNASDPARERLLAVAEELFTRHGFDAVSVRDLTSRAKVNLGAVTYHFGSKEALYHAAIERLAEPFAALIAAAAASPGTGLERIDAFVRAALNYMPTRSGGPITCLLRELANEGPLPPPITQLVQRNVGTVTALIKVGQADGSIRAGDPTLLALTAVSQPFYIKVAGRGIEQALGVKRGDPAVWARIVDHVAESVRRAIASDRSPSRKP